MSINRNMKLYMLQEKKKERTPSGQERITWTDKETITAALYKNSEVITVGSARYNASSHTGLTKCRTIKTGKNRLMDEDGTVYQIVSCNTAGRLTDLLLKETDTDV